MQKSLLTKTCQQKRTSITLTCTSSRNHIIYYYYANIKMSAYAYLQVMSAPSLLSSPSPGLPSNQKGICSHSQSPHTIATSYLSSSLPLSFYGFEIITVWFFPSSKQVFVSELSFIWNDTKLLQCFNVQHPSACPSHQKAILKSKQVSDRQEPDLFCARQKAKLFSNWWWFPAAMTFASQSYCICIYIYTSATSFRFIKMQLFSSPLLHC